VQIGFEYPCFYKGGNESVATLTPPHGFDGELPLHDIHKPHCEEYELWLPLTA